MDMRASWVHRLRSLGATALLIVLAAVALSTLLGFLGSWWWVFDLTSNFRVQYFIGGCLCAVLFTAARSWKALACAGGVILVNGALIAPLALGHPQLPAGGATPLKAIVFNINYANGRLNEVAEYLAEQDADLIVVLEATPEAVRLVSAALPGHEQIAQGRSDAFGIMLLSRLPLLSKKVIQLQGLPAIDASLSVAGESYAVLAMHTLPPVGASYAGTRDAMLGDAADWAEAHPGHAMIMGDFNATPWSSPFRALLSESNFVNSQAGFGVQTSWPRQPWPLAIPIDHCVHSRTLTAVARSVGPFLGSDHRPLHVALAPRSSSP